MLIKVILCFPNCDNDKPSRTDRDIADLVSQLNTPETEEDPIVPELFTRGATIRKCSINLKS